MCHDILDPIQNFNILLSLVSQIIFRYRGIFIIDLLEIGESLFLSVTF